MIFSRLTMAAALMCSVCLASPAMAAQKWDMPMAYPAGNFHTVNAVQFGECVKAGTGGEIDIVTHPNGSLFKGNDIKRAVQSGQTPIGERLLSGHENENPLYGLDSVPFIATSYEKSDKLWQAGKADITSALDAQGLVMLYSVPWPPQGLYFKKEVNSTADMKGVKIRSYNNATGRISELSGMTPVSIEASEITQALITGVIDSLITSAVTGKDSKAWEQLSHFEFPIEELTVLDDKTRETFRSCAAEAETRGIQMSKDANESALAELAQKGMKVLDPSEKLAGELSAIGETMANEWKAKAGDTGAAILEAYAK